MRSLKPIAPHFFSNRRTQFIPFCLLVLCALVCCCSHSVFAQTAYTPQSPQAPMTGDASGRRPGDTPLDAAQLAMQEKMALKRNAQRQEQLVKDTNRLLALATALKSDVDKTDKNTMSIDVIKRADEIEKLAKSVKEKMRN